MTEPDLREWLRSLFASTTDRAAAMQTAWQQLEAAGLLSKVTVHQYLCGKCGPLVRVIRLADSTIAYVKDYKLSPGMNDAESVPLARQRNTLDGKRWWPGCVYDVDELAACGPDAGFTAACRHLVTTVLAADVVARTRLVAPGHPGAPTRL